MVTAVRLDELEISFRQREVGEQVSRRDVDREAIETVAVASVRNPMGIGQHPGQRMAAKSRGAILALPTADAGNQT